MYILNNKSCISLSIQNKTYIILLTLTEVILDVGYTIRKSDKSPRRLTRKDKTEKLYAKQPKGKKFAKRNLRVEIHTPLHGRMLNPKSVVRMYAW